MFNQHQKQYKNLFTYIYLSFFFFFWCFQVQDKFRLDLSDEEAVHYMQSLIDESVGALFAAVVEQIHKFAQVSVEEKILDPQRIIQETTVNNLINDQ